MDFIDFSNSKIVVSRKKIIPVHYRKRYKANLSNSMFNQSFAIGIYKRKIKSLLESNRCLATAVQNYRSQCSTYEKMLAETSMAGLEHIFSARLKLNRLAEILKEACLSVEEILSLLQLCSSIYPSKFAQGRKSKQYRRKSSPIEMIESLAEVEELLMPDVKLFAQAPHTNQGENNPTSASSCEGNKSTLNSDLTESSSRSSKDKNCKEVVQELNGTGESVEPVDVTSILSKASCGSVRKSIYRNKVGTTKSRKRTSLETKTSNELNSVTPNLPNKALQNSQNVTCFPVSEEVISVLQDDIQFISAKKSKLSTLPTKTSRKQCSVKQKLPPSIKISNKKSKTENTLDKASKNRNYEVTSANGTFNNNHSKVLESKPTSCLKKDRYICEVDYSNLPEGLDQNEDQSSSTSDSAQMVGEDINSEDVQDHVSKLISKPEVEIPLNTDQHIHELYSVCTSSDLTKTKDKDEIPKSIVFNGKTRSSAKKLKVKGKVSFCFGSEDIDEDVTECKRTNYSEKCVVSKSKNKISGEVSHRPILHCVENIACLPEKSNKNIITVSAEIHAAPSAQCVPIKKLSISPKHTIKNMQPCVLLTDVFETCKLIKKTCDSSEDLPSCSEVQYILEDADSKVSEKSENKNSMSTESSPSSPNQCNRSAIRTRSTVSYKEPKLNVKMRRV